MGWCYPCRKLPTEKRTYGFRKSTILAALFNAVILLIAVGAILIESLNRFAQPEPVAGDTMIIVAGIGVVINTITALFMRYRTYLQQGRNRRDCKFRN